MQEEDESFDFMATPTVTPTTGAPTATTRTQGVQNTLGGVTYTVRDIAAPNSISTEAVHVFHDKTARTNISKMREPNSLKKPESSPIRSMR
jgi:hypothetical protein